MAAFSGDMLFFCVPISTCSVPYTSHNWQTAKEKTLLRKQGENARHRINMVLTAWFNRERTPIGLLGLLWFIELSPFEKTYLFTKSKPVNDCQFGLSVFVVSHLRNKQNKKGSLSETIILHLKMDETGRLSFLDGGFNYFLFSPLLEKDSHFDEHIFHMGGSTTNLLSLKGGNLGLCFRGKLAVRFREWKPGGLSVYPSCKVVDQPHRLGTGGFSSCPIFLLHGNSHRGCRFQNSKLI